MKNHKHPWNRVKPIAENLPKPACRSVLGISRWFSIALALCAIITANAEAAAVRRGVRLPTQQSRSLLDVYFNLQAGSRSPAFDRHAERSRSTLRNIDSNPAFSEATREILKNQVINDFAIYMNNPAPGRTTPAPGRGSPAPNTGVKGQLQVTNGNEDQLAYVDETVFTFVGLPEFTIDSISVLNPMFPSFPPGYAEPIPSEEFSFTDCTVPGPCIFPAEFDVKVKLMFVTWSVPVSHLPRLEEYISGTKGRSLRVYLRGKHLQQSWAPAWGPSQKDFHIWTNTSGCGIGKVDACMTIVFEKKVWFSGMPPWPAWPIRIEMWDTNELPMPIMNKPDKWGNMSVTYYVVEKSGERSVTIEPNPNMLSFWTATIGASILSERCTTCHAMDTNAKIQERHNGMASTAFMVPSLLVPGKSVLHCSNCHEQVLPYLGSNSPFDESKWATPTPELAINWGQMIEDYPQTWPEMICNRMIDHMPTYELRKQHFHEDARLFWAVSKGELPGNFPNLPTASPHYYDDFIKQFDLWNDSGAYCPQ